MLKTQAANPIMLEVAGKLLVLVGLVLCIGPLFADWVPETKMFISAGAVHIVFGFLLIIKQYWVRYFAFLFALIGSVTAYIFLGYMDIPHWQIWAYIIIDFLIICLLFISVWNGRVEQSDLAG